MIEGFYAVIGATLHQSTQWALKNGVNPKLLRPMNRERDRHKLMGLKRGSVITFVGRDQWWMSTATDEALYAMQMLTCAGVTVRFVSDFGKGN